jgi:hypothetical protein
MKRLFLIVSCIVLFLFVAHSGPSSLGQSDATDSPETLIKAARFLEQKPLEKEAKKVRSSAIQWLIVTDKVNIKICSLLLHGVDDKYKYAAELTGQYTIGMGAFKLSNPDRAQDEDAAQQAGIESALISYESMVAAQPKAKNPFMDDLLTKRSQGTLVAYVKENNCKDNK